MKIYKLAFCLIISGVLVVSLNIVSEIIRNRANGFIRLMPSHIISGVCLVKLPSEPHYIAGVNKTDFYIGNNGSPGRLIKISQDLKSLDILHVSAPHNMKVYMAAKLLIDSLFFYVPEGVKPDIIYGTLSPFKITQALRTPFFMDVLPLSSKVYILRSVQNMNNLLLKEQLYPIALKANKNILQSQGEGIFSTDGDIIKIPHSNKLFYVYRFRNQIICIDTNLNILYRTHTIDTVTHANIKVAAIHSKNQFTLASPPNVVNKQCSANQNFLFINSSLKADNETTKMHDKATAIDVYGVIDGKYQFSFYLPDFAGYKMTDFKVYDNTLIALFGPYLYKFHLNF